MNTTKEKSSFRKYLAYINDEDHFLERKQIVWKRGIVIVQIKSDISGSIILSYVFINLHYMK